MASPREGARAGALRPGQVRRLLQIFAVFRWGGGFAVLALAAIAVPSRAQLPLAGLIVWVGAYNGVATYLLPRLPDDSLRGLARLIGLFDVLSYFALVAVFGASTPPALYACYVCLLIPAVAFDGAAGAIASTAVFLAGLALLQLARLVLLGRPFPLPDLLLWSAVMIVIAASLTITQKVVAETGGEAGPAGEAPAARPALHLSPREREVLQLVAEGFSNTMIANRLHLSENTVKGYVESLLTRLSARNRAEAVAAASRLGLI